MALIRRILDAGYILNEDLKKYGRKKAKVQKSNIGIPQGIVLSFLFSNIVIHELDAFIKDELKRKFTKGKKQRLKLVYRKLTYWIKKEKDLKKKQKLVKQSLKVFYKHINDLNFLRFHYVRYFGDWVMLIAGLFKEAKVIRDQIFNKLKSLGFTLNFEKIHITSLKNGKCQFLGIDFCIRKNNDKCHKPTILVKKNIIIIKQRFAPWIILYVPILELITNLKEKGFMKRNRLGEFFPIGKTKCILLSHPQILNYFNSRIRDILYYYSCGHNRNELWSIVRFLNYSCALTLA